MKILYILEDGRLGGMSKMIFDIAKQIDSSENRVRIIVAEENSLPLLSIYKNSGLEINSVPIHFLSKKISELIKFIIFFIPDLIHIARQITRFDPQLVYCNGAQNIKGAIIARLMGKRVVWHMHDTYQPKPVLFLFRAVKLLFRIKYFVASSKRTIDFYKLPIRSTLLSRPPVDTEYFTPPQITSKNNENKYRIITVANINPDKGIDVLIETALKVNKARNDVQFNIIGLIPTTQNALFSKLTTLIRELNIQNISFLGQRNDIKDILASSDLYLCTSNNESGPIALFEAMAMCLPVVTTDVGDLREILAINNSGKVHPIKDSASLANEIVYLLGNPEIRHTLAQRGRQTAEEYLDIHHSKSRHLEFYTKIINQNL